MSLEFDSSNTEEPIPEKTTHRLFRELEATNTLSFTINGETKNYTYKSGETGYIKIIMVVNK
jgi:hypothetical protein